MSDTFTETSSQSWFSRIGNAFKGMLVGLVLFLLSFVLLFWNEGRTINRYKALKEAQSVLVEVDSNTVDNNNDKKLVYLNGDAKTNEILVDELFPVTASDTIKLKRKVEMFQWTEESKTETTKKLGGGEETKTTYSYKEVWRDTPIDSSQFKRPQGHKNPPMPFSSNELVVASATVGAFNLSESLISDMCWYEDYPISKPKVPADSTLIEASDKVADPATEEAAPDKAAEPATEEAAPDKAAEPAMEASESQTTSDTQPSEEATPETAEDSTDSADAPVSDETDVESSDQADDVSAEESAQSDLPKGFQYDGKGFYRGDSQNVKVGDVRVTFQRVPVATISLVSQQMGNTFAPYQTKTGEVQLLEKGVVSSESMFASAQNANVMLAWILRLVGFVMMLIGINMMFAPLPTIADVLPIAGSIVGFGLGLVAFILAAGLSLMTIAIAWLFYRPLIGVPLLIVAIALLLLPFFRKKKAATAEK